MGNEGLVLQGDRFNLSLWCQGCHLMAALLWDPHALLQTHLSADATEKATKGSATDRSLLLGRETRVGSVAPGFPFSQTWMLWLCGWVNSVAERSLCLSPLWHCAFPISQSIHFKKQVRWQKPTCHYLYRQFCLFQIHNIIYLSYHICVRLG